MGYQTLIDLVTLVYDVKYIINLSSEIDTFLKSSDESLEHNLYRTLSDLFISHDKNNRAFMNLLDEFKLEQKADCIPME
ncbi:hypothetical protein CKC_03520 [Candidatus Liberibacter solanacearum CLso-ZC1]|uniref:Uncharacterized protein n=1 Tax=Liberibacter solanacearum (strain CLso-ZC1) TaxID=658172 RepID=E4UBE8_LIBSC|nr:hypothetical protein [Candidatus Liberibacter solanacearum]ADR52453.1 hypothetical protein CKC_03520 [Candidatus Liberibacter solanacearum CLso-ZC1]